MELENNSLQQEMLWQRKQEIHRVGEEWSYMANVNLKHTLVQLQKEWKGESAIVFQEKGLELKERLNKTGKRLLEI